jgi:hypothetical protein
VAIASSCGNLRGEIKSAHQVGEFLGQVPDGNPGTRRGEHVMSMKIKWVWMVLLTVVGGTHAAVVGLNTFVEDYTGANVTTTLSPATTNGFKITYNTAASGNSFAIASAGLSEGPKTLAIGESAVLSFKYSTTKIYTTDLMFRWGIDFGDTVIQMRADTASAAGSYAANFLQEACITANGSTTNVTLPSGTQYANFDVALAPTSNYWFKTGNSAVAVTTTVTRTSATDYSIGVVWGGQTFTTTKTFAADHSIDSIFFGHGKDSGGGVYVDDNFTISDVSLNVIPEPATIGMLGIGALVTVLLRRATK